MLTVDGEEIAKQTMPHSIAFLMAIDETFDIGSDTRTGVDDSYKLPFRFTGKIDKLTYKLGATQISSDEQWLMRHALERARDGARQVLAPISLRRHTRAEGWTKQSMTALAAFARAAQLRRRSE